MLSTKTSILLNNNRNVGIIIRYRSNNTCGRSDQLGRHMKLRDRGNSFLTLNEHKWSLAPKSFSFAWLPLILFPLWMATCSISPWLWYPSTSKTSRGTGKGIANSFFSMSTLPLKMSLAREKQGNGLMKGYTPRNNVLQSRRMVTFVSLLIRSIPKEHTFKSLGV